VETTGQYRKDKTVLIASLRTAATTSIWNDWQRHLLADPFLNHSCSNSRCCQRRCHDLEESGFEVVVDVMSAEWEPVAETASKSDVGDNVVVPGEEASLLQFSFALDIDFGSTGVVSERNQAPP
jgi:hypothetical protein